MNENSTHDLDLYVAAAMEKKAEGVVVLNMADVTSIADAFIICSGRSNRQVSAIADHIVRALKEKGIRPTSVEGKSDGHWVLIDYGHVIIHVFFTETRRFYDLEGLWRDAQRITTESMKDLPKDFEQPIDGDEITLE